MKRVQLFEFEDFNWFPGIFRNSMTNVLVVLNKLVKTPEVLGGLLEASLKESGKTRVVDLGSGSGGAMPMVYESMKEKGVDVEILMTDYHPNPQAIEKFKNNNDASLNYHELSADARNLKDAPEGLKTMVNSFHHMPKEYAKEILQSAQNNKEPILIYEIAENNIPLVLWWLFLPISLVITALSFLVITPFVRPLTWHHLLFSYLIPVLPLFHAWDGQASLPRMYTYDDIDELIGEVPNGYTWKKGRAKDRNGKKRGTYLIGMPK